MALSKNVFARLFPALNDPDEMPASESEMPQIIPELQAKKPSAFTLPANSYSPPASDGGGSGAPNSFMETPEQQAKSLAMYNDLDPILQTITGRPNTDQIDELGRIGQAASRGDRYDVDASLASPEANQLADIGEAASHGGAMQYRDPKRYDINPLLEQIANLQQQGPASGPLSPTQVPELQQQQQGDVTYEPPPPAAGGTPGMPGTPALSRRDAAKKKLDDLRNKKLEDQDTSVKKRAIEVIGNILQGMSMAYKANPQGHWAGVLAGGAAGGVGGYVNKTWNEQRQHELELGRAREEYGEATQIDKDDNAFANDESERATKTYRALTERQRLIYDQLSDQQKAILDVWKELDEFDPDDPDPRVKELVERAKLANVSVLKKQKGERFTFNVTPAGKLIIGNTATGAYKEGSGDYAKPTSLTSNELPDNLFGIRSDKELEDEATASTAPQFANRRVRPEVAQGLIGQGDDANGYPYRNADGTLNEAAALRDGMLTSEGYEGLSEDKAYSQRRSQALNSLRGGQKWKQDAVTRFRTILTNAPAGNKAVPLNQIISDFKEVLEIKDAKKRSAKIEEYLREVLPYIRHK
jgi:hypothetical protein